MPSERVRQARIDIADNIRLAQNFAGGMDEAGFQKDQKTVYAVVRALEIISEASRRLPEDVRHRHKHLPWKKIAGAGNVYRHDYQNLGSDLVWITLQRSLPLLLTAVERELAE